MRLLGVARSPRQPKRMNPPLLLQTRFWPMWTALSLGAFADNLLRQSLIIGIAFGAVRLEGFSKADGAVPIIGSLFAVAMLVFSSIAGQVAEKYETAMLFRRTKFAEIILMAIAGVGFALNSGALLIVTLFAMGAQSAFFSPVRTGAMPKYLRKDELVRANGLCNAGLYVSILMGMFLGGLLIEREGGRLAVAGALFTAAMFGWLAILRAPPAAPDAPHLKLDWNPLVQSVRILGFAWTAPGVRAPMIGVAAFYYISTLVTVLVPLFVREALQGDGALATAIMGAFAIGAGIGALSAAALSKSRSGLGVSGVGAGVAALTTCLVYVLSAGPSPAAPRSASFLVEDAQGVALLLTFIFSSAAMGLFLAPLQAATQRRAPAETRSRIMAAGNMANAFAAMLGSLSVIAVTEFGFGARAAFLTVAGMQFAIVVTMAMRRQSNRKGLYDEAFAIGAS